LNDLLRAVILLGWALPLFADGEVIREIRVEGNRRVEESFIRSRIRARVGEPHDPEVVREDINRLTLTGQIGNVKVEPLPVEGGVALVYRIFEYPRIDEFRIEGGKKSYRRRLAKQLDFAERVGGLVAEYRIHEDRSAIERFFRERGYWEVRVESETRYEEDRAVLVYRAEPGRRFFIGKIRFEGNEHLSKRFLVKTARVQSKPRLWIFRKGVFDQAVWDRDREEIERVYRDEGWLDAKVQTGAVFGPKEDLHLPSTGPVRSAPSGKAGGNLMRSGRIVLRAKVEEGPRYTVERIRLEGHTVHPTELLRQEMKTREGALFQPRVLRDDEEKIRLLYGEGGYLLAHVDSSGSVYDAERRTVDLLLRIEEGERYFVDKIRFEGNDKTRDRVLRRNVRLGSDEPFNMRAVRDGTRRLRNLRYFDSIEPDVEEGSDERHKALVYRVEEAPTGMLTIGAAYSSDDRLMGNFVIRQRNFDIRELDRFPRSEGGGQNMELSLNPGSVSNRYTLSFFEPWWFDRPYGLGTDLFHKDREFRTYRQTFDGGEVRVSRRFELDSLRFRDLRDDVIHVGLAKRVETAKIDRVEPTAPAAAREMEGHTEIRALRPFFIWDRRDDPHTPTVGYEIRGSHEYAGDFLGGVDYSKSFAETNIHFPVYGREREQGRHVLSLGASSGWVEPHSNSHEVPIFERFFTGGASSVRGFRYRTISPKDGFEPVGGRFLLQGTVEYHFPITSDDTVRGAIFADRGTVEAKFDGDVFDEFRSSAGMGFRIKVPISPVPLRFDWGFPLEKEHEDERDLFSFQLSGVF
jgi:outer membrane protein insertion porin family